MTTCFFTIIIKDGTKIIQNIDIHNKITNDLSDEFEKQRTCFSHNKTNQEFTGTYKLDKGEIFCIEKLRLDDEIENILKNPTSCTLFTSISTDESIKAIFATQYDNQNKSINILFQAFTPSRIIDRSTWVIFQSKNTFNKFSKLGMIFAKKLDAIYDCQQKSLYFYSYSNVRQFLNLDKYFHEATDEEIKKIFKENQNEIYVPNVDLLLPLCDSVARKKFTQIGSSGILKNVKLPKITREAKKLKITIDTANNKLNFPNDKKQLKELLQFLAEDIYIGPLSDKRFVSNSKKITD
jgi:hypothetical protein